MGMIPQAGKVTSTGSNTGWLFARSFKVMLRTHWKCLAIHYIFVWIQKLKIADDDIAFIVPTPNGY